MIHLLLFESIIHLFGETASPFIDEGDGLTRERERVRMLLSLVAHAVGYKMMVGAHNTVCVRRMWEVLPYSPCMANDGVHNTVDAQRHVGCFTVFAWYGS